MLVDRADAFVAAHPGSEDALRRIFTLKLASVREDGEPTRRRAFRSEFSGEEWRLVANLPTTPTACWSLRRPTRRHLSSPVALRSTGEEGRSTYAEVAHEAIFRRWDRLRDWIAAEREFLAWRSGLEAARRAWQATPESSKYDALLMGAALTQAQSWFLKRAEDLPAPDREFIARSIEREKQAQTRARRVRGGIYGLAAIVILGLVGWMNQTTIADEWRFATVTWPYERANIRPYVWSTAKEQTLKPGDSFRECAPKQQDTDDCPDMVVVPAGSFTMGGPTKDEQPQHQVTFAKPFAVAKDELTFAQWDACVAGGGCNGYKPVDQGWGRGQQPAINVNWDDAQA